MSSRRRPLGRIFSVIAPRVRRVRFWMTPSRAEVDRFVTRVVELLAHPLPNVWDEWHLGNHFIDVQGIHVRRNPPFHEVGVRFRLANEQKPVRTSHLPLGLGRSHKRPILGPNASEVEPTTYDYTFRVRSGQEVADFPACQADFYDFIARHLGKKDALETRSVGGGG
jgi:hypothetical protein